MHNNNYYKQYNLDHPLDLNSLLTLLQGHVTSKWYQFGLALGVPKKILDQLINYSEEDSLVEVLDYWLTHHPNQPTWQEVSDAQNKINFTITNKRHYLAS